MKKAFIIISMSALMLSAGTGSLMAQEQPEPKKDTVNMDTNAKPEFYYEVEDEEAGAGKSSAGLIAIIAGAVVVLGGAAFVMMKKKK
ncbi:MAG: hypothetical protein MUD02_11020 [Bacteroidales bacterium]|jgi:hypothetical protein|nr:hypothetical protein [Bacteroidales bacterium]MCU0409469.1 hypothetical protein [Bacteroidales bacterium]